MNLAALPNAITVSRIAAAPFVFALVLSGREDAIAAAAAIFLLCGLLDKVDGWLARRLRQVSAFGIIWDPLADKILIIGTMLAAAAQGLMPFPFIYLCIARDLIVSGLRAGSNLPAEALAADRWGKWKTRLQFAVVFAALVGAGASFGEAPAWRYFYWFLLAATAIVTVLSAVRYARRYRDASAQLRAAAAAPGTAP